MIISPEDFLKGTWTEARSRRCWDKAIAKLEHELMRGLSYVVCLCGIPGSGKTTWASAQDTRDIAVFDSTALSPRSRCRVVRLCRQYNTSCYAVAFETDVDVCVQRRQTDKVVAEARVRAMYKAYERPTITEGFDSVTVLSE